MDPDQTAPNGAVRSGFIVFASMIKCRLKYTQTYAADVQKPTTFSGPKFIGMIRVGSFYYLGVVVLPLYCTVITQNETKTNFSLY